MADGEARDRPLVQTIGIGVLIAVVGGLLVALITTLLGGGRESESRESESTAPPATTETIAAAPATSAARPAAGTTTTGAPPLPYRADWSSDLGGWVGTDEWRSVRGQLVNDGEGRGSGASVTAPVVVPPGTDYAVEAEIQLVRNADGGRISGMASFGVVVRTGPDGEGYGAGRCVAAGIFTCGGPESSVAVLWTAEDETVLDAVPFAPGDTAHRYRLEVRGNQLAAFIDGAPVLQAVDNTHPDGGRIGLWSDRAQIAVLGFEVTAI